IYSGTIDNTDRAIGRLVANLEKLGELDNTIIIYASDNGSYLQKRNGELRGKKGSLFEGGHRVPGIFYWKDGIPGGRVEEEPAGVVDLLPTLCGLIGIEKPKDVQLDGSDLAPLLTSSGSFKRHQPLFWMGDANMVMRVGNHTLLASSTAKSPIDFKTADRLMEQVKDVLGDDLEKELGGMDLRSRMFNGKFANPEANRLRDQHRRLYYFQESWIPELKKSGLGRVQLYDLSKDPSQKDNIALKRPELATRLKKQAAVIYRSVMVDAPEWPGPEELSSAKKPRKKGSVGSAALAPDTDTAKLLARIDKNSLPDDYDVSRHQPYVDRVMAGLKPEQRERVGQLWKERRRLTPKMKNVGQSFVRILNYVANGEKASIEEKTGIHRLSTTKRSTYDAFSYLNRIPDVAYEDESVEDFLGRIFGRLANQEGRVLLKAPTDMGRLGYQGLKTFLNYEGTESVGNCAACHTLPNFTDEKSYVTRHGTEAKPTPSLRNLGKRKLDLHKVMSQKIEAAKQKQQGKADDISDAYLKMKLNKRDVSGLVAFLRLLKDESDDQFRQSIIEAKVLDTSED
ncbi:sulfatase-like hydrolase/transferase, partial [bacterium]|nr:sulfatase-like hydrolase/transferase [bacterium]